MRPISCAFISIISVFFSGCSDSGPTEQQLRNYAARAFPSELTIVDFTQKVFPGQQGTGRASVAGKVSLNDDFYAPTNSTISSLLAEKGLNQEEINYVGSTALNGSSIYYRPYGLLRQKGSQIPFSGEYVYMTTASGFNFSGGLNYERPAGVTLANLPPNTLLIDSTELDQMLDMLRTLAVGRSTDIMLKKQALAELLVGKVFQAAYRDTTPNPSDPYAEEARVALVDQYNFTVAFTNDLEWQAETLAIGGANNFSIMATATFNGKQGSWGNDYYVTGQRVPMRVEGFMTSPASGQPTIVLVLNVPSSDGGFYNTGDQLVFENGAFNTGWRNVALSPVGGSLTAEPSSSGEETALVPVPRPRQEQADTAIPLSPGTYVNNEVACGEASNATIMRFDGISFSAGRMEPVSPKQDPDRASTYTFEYPAQDGADAFQMAFQIQDPKTFALNDSVYRYCANGDLPEIWRE